MLLALKRYGRIVISGIGFLYDYLRFIKYSAWNANMNDEITRNYHAFKIYHA